MLYMVFSESLRGDLDSFKGFRSVKEEGKGFGGARGEVCVGEVG